MPVQTAVKTGTSTDYRDAWAVGFNYRYVVGIWMGNLDRSPTDGVTGSTGPALALRGIFAQLNQNEQTKPLFLSPKLVKQEVCLTPNEKASDEDKKPCFTRTEYFIRGTEQGAKKTAAEVAAPVLVSPTEGLQMAIDPRIPRRRQKFEFYIAGLKPMDRVEWIMNGLSLAHTEEGKYLWDLDRGKHKLKAIVSRAEADPIALPEVEFIVK